ncbi:MAG: hypothetical protein M2R45_01927 [Verrucomicrobia subdivision 3 bacterium]|nr:hypothetical protein [Limisphaerales bacterium]MCS1416207.1 hypothetical protein [Limisphaerales bacterium]
MSRVLYNWRHWLSRRVPPLGTHSPNQCRRQLPICPCLDTGRRTRHRFSRLFTKTTIGTSLDLAESSPERNRHYQGQEFTRFAEENSIEYITCEAHTTRASGELTTILFYEECCVKSTGRVFKNGLPAVAKEENEKLTQFWEYSGTAAMETAFSSA